MKTEREKKLEIALLKEKLERVSGKKVLFKEAYRDLEDNLTILNNCKNLKYKEYSGIRNAAINLLSEYEKDKSTDLDEGVEMLLDEYDYPESIIPYETY